MKNCISLSLLSPIALAGFFCLSPAKPATALTVAVPTPAIEQAATSLETPVYYTHGGHRYAYRYRGRYYNHRRYSNGHWGYY